MFWELIGKLFAAYVLLRVLFCIWQILRAYLFPIFGWRVNFKAYGEWAVITGATDGIGKAYALELARMGLKTVLISRTQEKLDQVAAEIEEKYKVETKTISYDFSMTDGYEKIENGISGLDIGTLVNNVGMGYEYPDILHSFPVESYEKMINVNVLSLVKMTHMVIKGMSERKKGILIHVSSASADFPVPFLTVYSATKAFVDFFAQAIQSEYRNKGIISQSVTPFFVETKLSGVRSSLMAPKPIPYVRQALGTVGIAGRTHGYIMHTLQHLGFHCLPLMLTEKTLMEMMSKARAKYLRKKAKKQ